MLLLVTNTSGKGGFVALARTEERVDARVIESAPLTGGTFSAQLVPQIAGLLRKHGFSKGDIDAFVVVSGPGSFTGLRVGLAAIKALAEILNKPIVPVSLLEVVATASGVEGNIVSVLDAGRGEVYLGEYESRDGNSRLIREYLSNRNDAIAQMRTATLATPDEALATLQNGGTEPLLVQIDAATIARVGWAKLRAGQTVSPDQLEANYIRRSGAEIFAKPATSS